MQNTISDPFRYYSIRYLKRFLLSQFFKSWLKDSHLPFKLVLYYQAAISMLRHVQEIATGTKKPHITKFTAAKRNLKHLFHRNLPYKFINNRRYTF